MSEVGRANRVPALMDEISESLKLLESNLPTKVDGFALSQESKLPWKVLLYREALIWRVVELGRSAFENLGSNKLVSGIVLTRATVETTAALWYLCAKVAVVVDSKVKGDIDECLMKLAMGTATGWPEQDPNPTCSPVIPRPVQVGKFLKQVEKDIEGFSYQYGVLSEYAHPNWAGTVLLYSDTNKKTAITNFGQNMRKGDNAKAIGVVSLNSALKLFRARYNRLSDLLPAFINLCESASKARAAEAF